MSVHTSLGKAYPEFLSAMLVAAKEDTPTETLIPRLAELTGYQPSTLVRLLQEVPLHPKFLSQLVLLQKAQERASTPMASVESSHQEKAPTIAHPANPCPASAPPE